MAVDSFDVVVVGAGIQGSSTALYLARNGRKVLLLDQFSLPHTRGSSHGQSRLIRSSYSEDFFCRMMVDAFALWRQIEEETGKELIYKTGLLVIGEPPDDEWESGRKNMAEMYPKHLEEFTLDQARAKYPMIAFGQNVGCYLDKTGGVIRANIALQAVQDLYRRHGGEILDGCPLTQMDVSTDKVVLKAGNRTLTCASVVLCCGPWANKVLKLVDLQLPLQPQRVQVHYFQEKQKGQYSMESGFPSFMARSPEGLEVYGMPSIEYSGMAKIGVHHGVDSDPDERDKCAATDVHKKLLDDLVPRYFSGLDPEAAIIETCMYTITPDESFILDRHPKYKNVVIGAGFSGSGFKLGPLVGEILGQLALGLEPRHDMKPFSMYRF